MKPSQNGADSANGDRRHDRPGKLVASPLTLIYKDKIYRGSWTVVGRMLIVCCGKVGCSIELRPGHPEAQAREILFKLASAGKLAQYAFVH